MVWKVYNLCNYTFCQKFLANFGTIGCSDQKLLKITEIFDLYHIFDKTSEKLIQINKITYHSIELEIMKILIYQKL